MVTNSIYPNRRLRTPAIFLAASLIVSGGLHADYTYVSHFEVSGNIGQASFDSQGELLITDTENNDVLACDLAGACATLDLSNCIPPEFEDAWGVAQYGMGWIVLTDAFGDALYICDRDNLIDGKAYDEQGAALGQFLLPRQVTVNINGDIILADSGNERIQIRNRAGEWSSIGGPRGTEAGRFWEPSGVAVVPNGNLVVADSSNDRIQVCSPEPTDPGNCIVIGMRGSELGQFNNPEGVTVDNSGRIIVADTNNNRVQICSDPICDVIDGTCQICDATEDWAVIDGTEGTGQFEWPVSVATDRRGNLVIAEYSSNRIQIFGDPSLFPINPGLNDHWYNPATDGSGIYVTVFPVIGKVNISMFTYDSVPPAGGSALLGDISQRWLNGLGKYSGNTATLKLSYNYGGIFDSPLVTTKVNDYGTAVLTFHSCTSGTFAYEIPSLGLAGTIPIQRIVGDNIALCEAFLAGVSPW